jgi:hypothetical protein
VVGSARQAELHAPSGHREKILLTPQRRVLGSASAGVETASMCDREPHWGLRAASFRGEKVGGPAHTPTDSRGEPYSLLQHSSASRTWKRSIVNLGNSHDVLFAEPLTGLADRIEPNLTAPDRYALPVRE